MIVFNYYIPLSFKPPDFMCATKIYLSSYFAETFWPRWAKLTGCQANNGPLTSANTHFTSQKGVKRPTHNSMSTQTSSNDIFSRPLKSIAKSFRGLPITWKYVIYPILLIAPSQTWERQKHLYLETVAQLIFYRYLNHLNQIWLNFYNRKLMLVNYCTGKSWLLSLEWWIYRVFFKWYPPKKLKYGKPRLGVFTLT